MPAVLSAADEVAVEAFLKEQIKFTDIAKLIYTVLKGAPQTSGDATLNQALDADAWAREYRRLPARESSVERGAGYQTVREYLRRGQDSSRDA